MELLIVAGLGVGALVVLFVAFKLVKAMLRMVFVAVFFVALIVVGATWGRPYLVQAWDSLRSTGAASTSPSGPRSTTNRTPIPIGGPRLLEPIPEAKTENLSTAERNAMQRRAVVEELNRQEVNNRPKSSSSRRRSIRRRSVSKGTSRVVR